ncbi:MAG: tail fiber domain-containing protein [Asticcacaulis sp.]|nr:tail fiber domain-containing protein [Asticcacaulis sp.]
MGGKTKTTTNSTTTNPYAVQQFQSASASLPKAYSPVTADQIDQYQNPYTSSVIDATLARSNQNQQMALNGNQDQAIRSGAFGGSGQSVADALTKGQFDLNNQQTIAGLNQANYSQALQTATGQNSAQNQYPLAIQALLAQIAQGTTQTTNGTQTTKAPIDWSGLLSGVGSAASGAASLMALSDHRLKHDIVPIGERHGRKWYRFKYLWDDIVHEGVMAQENMDIAIRLPSGFYAVNYGAI